MDGTGNFVAICTIHYALKPPDFALIKDLC